MGDLYTMVGVNDRWCNMKGIEGSVTAWWSGGIGDCVAVSMQELTIPVMHGPRESKTDCHHCAMHTCIIYLSIPIYDFIAHQQVNCA